jgi:tRNA(Arg) A34 adenosine deaminase TadA
MSPDEMMMRAIQMAADNFKTGNGGPFGAVIAKNGKIIAEAGNRVTSTNDPTAHAEIVAIREACHVLETFDLTGCEIFASCEPCPMCMGAILWSRISRVYFAANRHDAANAGFDDERFYRQFQLHPTEQVLKPVQLMQKEAKVVFEEWNTFQGKTTY